ncbi:MAG: phage GP46 family protein [Pseudomonadota bacterium]
MDFAISNNGGTFALALAGTDISTDMGLRGAVYASLFTDRRAEPDDVLPDGSDNRRGHWADQYAEHEGDLKGSRLWLLKNAKQTPETLFRAKRYAEEALAWFVADGIATSIAAAPYWYADGVLALPIDMQLADGRFWNDVFYYSTETA